MKLSQDVLLGLFFVVFGVVSVSVAMSYPFGTSGRMGPGYFPVIISSLLVLTGLLVLFRSQLAQPEILPAIRWKPLLLIPGAVVIFGLAVETLGLPLAVLLLTILTAATSIKFHIGWKTAAGSLAFAALCSVVFIELLGLPIPIVGSWLRVPGF
ncbi:tripartite tricarboxylate transporter TctB family protein [Neorhizobium galegae]|uniref:tripartite tricarboxylate transporter TctB family protein n=1 Tax=Neorhizobium galegae TaxID=399 RepID=UPI000621CE0C|nr:tripartite tricarboxylate transporter TctB family protein [Neorhizobium galegae]MCQ1767839.1 tripartite tricarboxylate transporter TctB family protein [Neorhizobium galegae]MCQ1848178.1 tripartite tricarboxylate transporter TctB family protein [Neorhizobium galegae]CDZ26870.1 Tripartite tricarboxylate transporter TctB family [Neorhizobium galegae bv. officinalis]